MLGRSNTHMLDIIRPRRILIPIIYSANQSPSFSTGHHLFSEDKLQIYLSQFFGFFIVCCLFTAR